MRSLDRGARILAFTLFLAGSSYAARRGGFAESLEQSRAVVLGQVLQASSYYGSDGEIYTDVTVQVRSKAKDRASRTSDTVTFTVPGGTVGDTRVVFSETPEFSPEEAVLLLLDDQGQPVDKYTLNGDWVPELGQTATRVLDDLAASGDTAPAERNRARQFLEELGPPVREAADAPVCYALMGPKWGNAAATYKLNASIPSAWNTSVANGANAWSQAGSAFRFSANDASANEISFATLSGGSTLAQTRIEYSPSSNTLRRFTVTFNRNFPWSTTGEAGKFDVQGITAHELGHAIGLNHPSAAACSEQTMWSSAASGETKKRTLEDGDKAGAVVLYPTGGTTPPPPPPPPPPAPTGPVLDTLSSFPATPRANAWFYLQAAGARFSQADAQWVIRGGTCPGTGCIVQGNQVFVPSSTEMFGVTRLPAGSYTVAIRNGSAGTPSATKPLTVQ